MTAERDPRTDPQPGDTKTWTDRQGDTFTAEVKTRTLSPRVWEYDLDVVYTAYPTGARDALPYGVDLDTWSADVGGTARWAVAGAAAPIRADVLALRDAFVAAGRALFDALDVFALAAGGEKYERAAVTVYLSTGGIDDQGGDVLGWGGTPALTVGYDAYPYDAWATPEALADAVAAKAKAAEEWAASCRAVSARAVVESARRTLEAAGWGVTPPPGPAWAYLGAGPS